MPFYVTLMLADSAQALDNKLYILGGGWSVTGPDPTPSALAVNIKVPWDRANEQHHMVLELLDDDGNAVEIPTPAGGQPMRIESDFEVGRPPGLRAGTPIDFALAINLPPLPIPPGGRYEWRLRINEERGEDWFRAFTTRPSATPPPGEGPPTTTS